MLILVAFVAIAGVLLPKVAPPAHADNSAAAFVNGSFESPQIGGFAYSVAGSGWTFSNNAGIQHNGSAYSGSSPIAPDGTQTAFVQGVNGTLGTMSQSVNFAAGTYSFGFQAARRYGAAQPIQVSIDGTAVGTYTPAGATFAPITTGTVSIAAGLHTLMFAAADSSADKTSFIDAVIITSVGTGSAPGPAAPTTPTNPLPAAPAGVTALGGNGQVTLSWTASSGATNYSVFRGTSSGGEVLTPATTGITGTTSTITNLTNGTAYFFTVQSLNTAGTSTRSNETTATPTSPAGATGTGADIDVTGYGLAFDDEFNGLSVTANTPKASSTWYGYPPYGPAGNYSSSTWDVGALSTANGILSARAYLGTSPGISGNYWYSGNLSSVDTTGTGFSQRYGYFEARIEMPNSGTGAWPAFWLASTDGIAAVSPTRVPGEEVDIAEWYGVTNTAGSLQSVMQQASHNYNADGSQNTGATPYLYAPQTPIPGGAYPWQSFHIYGVQIDSTHITWFIDGVRTNQIATPTQYLTSPLYMMLDYGLGGGWPLSGMVNGSAMQVDWVRAYTLPGQ